MPIEPRRQKLTKGAPLKTRLEFRRRIDPTTNCWIYTGHCDKDGYGQIKVDGKVERVNRVALKVYKDVKIDQALHVPTCLNKSCFNPEHLYNGDFSDNVMDRHRLKD